MRIALFTETFLPKLDGIVNTLCHLLTYLDEQGHESILFAPEGGPKQYAGTQVHGLPGHVFPLYPEIKLVPPTIDVRDDLIDFQPDLIHVLNPLSLGLIGLRHARQMEIPVAASFHTDLSGFAEQWGLGILSEPLWGYMRWVHNQADLNLCPSMATLQDLEQRQFERLKVWTRGVDTELFHPNKRTAEWRERLSGGDPSAPLLLYVGRVSAEKRIDQIRRVLDVISNARLAIVGDGPARSDLEAHFAGTNTVFTGFLSGEDLAAAYAAADVFVFPAANETLGNVVLEAMASGLPVVATASGGPLDIVCHDETGLLVNPTKPQELVDAVRTILENPDKARDLSTAGRAYAETRSWASVFSGLMDDYEWAIANRRIQNPVIALPESVRQVFEAEYWTRL